MRDVETHRLIVTGGEINTVRVNDGVPAHPLRHQCALNVGKTGPRGGVTVANVMLTDERRRQLIQALGGYPDPPEVYIVQRDTFDGLYLFEHCDQADEYAGLFSEADIEPAPHPCSTAPPPNRRSPRPKRRPPTSTRRTRTEPCPPPPTQTSLPRCRRRRRVRHGPRPA